MKENSRFSAQEHYHNDVQSQKRLSEDSHDVSTLIKLGKGYYSSGDYKNAAQYCQQVLTAEPANVDALKILSYIYYYEKKHEQAIEYCNRWVASDIQNSSIPLALLNEIYQEKAHREQQEKIQIEREKVHLEEAAKFRRKLEQMIQQYAHTLANTLFPGMIYEVARKLKNHHELKSEALFLLRAYQAEVFIYKQGELLEIKHTGDAKKFRSYIRRSCLSGKIGHDFTTLDQILNAVTARVVTRFLNQSKLAQLRQRLSELRGMSVDEWRTSFDHDVFFTEQQTPVQWASTHIARIEYTLSPSWKALKFQTGEESYAETLLWGHFGELLFNALKYTDHRHNQGVRIRFDENEDYLTSIWENPCSGDVSQQSWRSKGLDSIRNDLEMLNQIESTPASIENLSDQDTFRVKLYFAKSVFFYQSQIRRAVHKDKEWS